MPYSSSLSRRRKSNSNSVGSALSSAPNGSRADDARRELLDRVCDFTLKHGLRVNGVNLGLICNGLSGANAELSEAFATREVSGEPVDQRWLDTLGRLDPATNGRINELEKLMDHLEYSIVRFAQTTKTAQDETSGHRGAIDAQIEAIEKASEAVAGQPEVERVINLSRTMLESIEQAESAMEKSQAETQQLREHLAKARTEADVDHLTGLPNRRAFERRLESAAKEARANSEPLCVAFCDVDHFKQVNDRHGHDAGDRVLCSIAATLNENASDHCFVARHGGEEFVVLFYGDSKQEAWQKLDGIRRAQAAKQLMNRDTGRPFGKITFSGGLAEVTEDVDTRSALARADEALYQAKEAGRDQIATV